MVSGFRRGIYKNDILSVGFVKGDMKLISDYYM